MRHPAKYTDTLLPVFADILKGCPNVLDPMAGTGKIGLLKDHGYKGWIVCNELEPEWITPAPPGVDEVHIGDAEDMDWAEDERFAAICTSPTYANRLADHHDARDGSRRNTYRHTLGRPLSPGNTGMMQWGKEYRQKHVFIWIECKRVLKSDGLMVVNVSDHIRKGQVVRVVDWHVKAITGIGLLLVDKISVETPRLRFGANSDVRVSEEWVLVFRKM